MKQSQVSPSPERNEIGFLDNLRHMWYFSHTNGKVNVVFALNRRPLTKYVCVRPSLAHTHMPYPAAPPHTVTIWKLEIICIRSQLLLDSSYPLHLLFIFPNPFVFPCSVHICSTAATLSFFLPLPWAPPSFVSSVIKPTLFSDYFKRFCQSYDLMTPIIIDYYN